MARTDHGKIKQYDELISALELAKRRIEDETSDFICYALPQTPMGNYIGDHIIMPGLYPSSTMESWLWNNFMRGSPRRRRIIWLNALIKQAKQERAALGRKK